MELFRISAGWNGHYFKVASKVYPSQAVFGIPGDKYSKSVSIPNGISDIQGLGSLERVTDDVYKHVLEHLYASAFKSEFNPLF